MKHFPIKCSLYLTPLLSELVQFRCKVGVFFSVYYIHCSIICYLCSSETSPLFYPFRGSGRFPFKVLFLSRSQVHVCGKSFTTCIAL
jgi:hypothetical protein